MIVSDIQTRVKAQFGDTSGAQLTDADIIRWINDAQKEIGAKKNIFQAKGTIATIIGTQTYNYPAGLVSIKMVSFDGVILRPMNKEEVDEFLPDQEFDSTSTGTPQSFWVFAQQIYLYPRPDRVKNLTVAYTRMPVEVTTNADTPELPIQFHTRIVDYCMAQAAQKDDDLAGYTTYMQRFEGKTDQMPEQQQTQQFYPGITVSVRDAGYWGDTYGSYW